MRDRARSVLRPDTQVATSALPFRGRYSLRALSLGVVVALILTLISALSAVPAHAADSTLRVTDLRADDLVNPLGIDGDAPHLSWQTESDGRGITQTAYEVRMASSETALSSPDVWSSGRVESAEQLNVVYVGPALESRTRYVWQVRVSDSRGLTSEWSEAASFETALLDTDEWSAEWIGAPTSDINEWTDYTIDLDATVTPNRSFGVFFRAEDTQNGYMWQFNDKDGDGNPLLRPHVKINGAWTLLKQLDLTTVGMPADVFKSRMDVRITVSGSNIATWINGTEVDVTTHTAFAKGFPGFRVDAPTGEIDEEVLVHSMTVTSPDRVLWQSDFESGQNPFGAGTLTENGLLINGRQEVLWSTSDGYPQLRKDFSVETGVASARLYASARGNYEMSLNGAKVGDHELAPGSTKYEDRIQYQSFDVTDQISEGANTIGGLLAPGWYTGHIAWLGDKKYGDKETLIAQLVIEYGDGSTQVVVTDSTWQTTSGPIVDADLQMGETYDARLEHTGWNTPGYDASGWTSVWVDDAGDAATALLRTQTDPPVRVTAELPAIERTEPSPGVYVYDLGQNFAGIPEMRVTGIAGDTITLRHAEVLNPDGTMYVANLRTAKATDHYTFAETGTIEYRPTFTQHGFRYIEITGVTSPPTIDDVSGLVFNSDLDMTGSFETSDPMLNQLQSNIVWGQRSNFISVPTDTPARDERLGYTGDLNAFAATAMFNMDSTTFIRKFMRDVSDQQKSMGTGNYPQNTPLPAAYCCDPGSAWSDGGITIPWNVWRLGGDTQIISEHWDSMEWYMEYLAGAFPTGVRDEGPYGDWLYLDQGTPGDVIGTAYYAYDARLMSEMADAVGRTDDAARYAQLADRIKATFVEEFVSSDGRVSGDSQTGYSLALGMELLPDELRDKAGEHLVGRVAAADYHLATGFVGTPWLLTALSGTGHWDVAYRLLMNKTYPSWGYEVEMGATTMWERWNSIRPDGSFGPPAMNSFNHYAFGAVGDWMYQNIGGIQATEAGYHSVTIAPMIGGGLTHASTSFDGPYGTITSDWSLEGSDVSLAVQVPTNTSAHVRIPAENAWAVTESGVPLDEAEGVEVVSSEGESVVVRVGSGSYELRADSTSGELGAIIDAVAELQADVDAPQQLVDALAEAHHELTAAHAQLAVPAESSDHVAAGLSAVRAAIAVDGLEQSIVDRLTAIDVRITALLAQLAGVEVTVDLAATEVMPGATAQATVTVSNGGDSVSLDDLGIRVTGVDGWTTRVDQTATSVEPGGELTLTLELDVPVGRDPGAVQFGVEASFTRDSLALTVANSASLTVSTPLQLTTRVDPDNVAPESVSTLIASVHNLSDIPVDGRVSVTPPDGWPTVAPSAPVSVAAGETREIQVPLSTPLTLDEGVFTAVAAFERSGVVLASSDTSISTHVPVPEAAADHIDLGNGASETDHDLTASEGSGQNSEGGFTRRYTSTGSGQFFSFDLEVPAGEPFLIVARETYSHAGGEKSYDIDVDGTVVQERVYPFAADVGANLYQVLVDDPELVSESGTVRLTFEDDGKGFDPSLADVWVVAVPADSLAPTVTASVDAGTIGDAGWLRSPATVTLQSSDNRSGEVMIEYDSGDGWASYDAPVIVAAEGETEVSYRATDAAGNVSPTATEQLRIDTVPTTTSAQLADPIAPGIALAPAVVNFTAADETSGVREVRYRLDGGDWVVADAVTIAEPGSHTVEFGATDVAGNIEPAGSRQLTVLTEVPEGPLVSSAISNPGEAGWHLAGAAVTLSAAAPGDTDVDLIEYRLGDDANGGEWLEYTAPVDLPEGTTTVEYRATAGGISSEPQKRVVKVDASAPVGWGWFTAEGRVSTAIQDAISGVALGEYSLDGDEWVTGLDAFAAIGSGAESVFFRANDVAGNSGVVLELTPQASASTLLITPGHSILVEASGFTPGQAVRVELHSEPVVLGDGEASDRGVVTVTARVPDSFPAGEHSLVFVTDIAPAPGGDGSDPNKTIPVEILPDTGASGFEVTAAIAVLALLLGFGLIIIRRRREA